ncbi:uncharacterized protein LOC119326603 [Triticum dicoccoides]|uniref:uncharacterized protein LOC119326603 n=1 Tax=Triticum dicoccoides TaxID=85692 RepID=UPI001891D47F|nr:uncharacterized protein LOC119326603 [Triticum dicoccoides]
MVPASTVTMLSRTWTLETEKYFASRRIKATDRISAKKPVRTAAASLASATDQPLHLHPLRQVLSQSRSFPKSFDTTCALESSILLLDLVKLMGPSPKWPEITESTEPGQKTVDRSDITVRVYRLKLLEYLQKMRTGRMFGPIVAVIHTGEFHKRELPHACVLVWQEKHHDRGSQLTDIDADAPATMPPNTMETTVPMPLKLNSFVR